MKTRSKGKAKRTDPEGRIQIQACLHPGMSLDQIAFSVGKSESAACREILRNFETRNPASGECQKPRKPLVCNVRCKKRHCSFGKKYYDFRKADELAESRKRSARSRPKLPPEAIKAIDPTVSERVRTGRSLHHIHASSRPLRAGRPERRMRRLVYRGCLPVRAHELRRCAACRHEYAKTPEELAARDIRFLIGRRMEDSLGSTGSAG